MRKIITSILLLTAMAAYSQSQEHVGINTEVPQATLHVEGDSVILMSDQYGTSLRFVMDEFDQIVKTMENLIIKVDSAKHIYLNPSEPDAKVSIGSYTIGEHAVFSITSDDKGIYIPRLIQDSIDAISFGMGDNQGLLLYNISIGAFQVYDGSQWQTMAYSSGGSGLWSENGLGEAYRLSNVGIGNNDPAEALDVEGQVIVRGDRLDFRPQSGGTFNWFSMVKNGLDFSLLQNTNEGDLYILADKDLHFQTDDSGVGTRMTLKRDGSLGIGTNLPTEELHIVGPVPSVFLESGFATELELSASTTEAVIKTSLDHPIHFITDDINRLSIDGNMVGLGWVNPIERLDVQGAIRLGSTSTSNAGTIKYTNNDFQGFNGTEWLSLTDKEDGDIDDSNEIQQLGINGNVLSLTNGGGSVTIPTSGGGGSSLWTDNGSSEIYYNAGDVGIGVTNPSSDLHVVGVGTGGEVVDFTSGDLTGSGDLLNLTVGAASTNTSQIIEAKRGTTDMFRVNANGDTYIGGQLGIGVSNPTTSLDIAGGMVIGGGLSLNPIGGEMRYYNGIFEGFDGNNWLNFGKEGIWSKIGNDAYFEDGKAIVNSSLFTGNFRTEVRSGAVEMFDILNQSQVTIDEGQFRLSHDNGNASLYLTDSEMSIRRENGASHLRMVAQESIDEGARFDLYGKTNVPNQFTNNIVFETNDNPNEGAKIYLRDFTGRQAIILDTDFGSNARITTDELEIKGGSDFAEHFDIIETNALTPKAGMIVSIDPASTGKLEVASTAYDRKVAGIISGANGVKTGLMMGQTGSIADGDYPVALSGRVYVYANKEGGDIKPGDLLTTSSQSGYAMKVGDYAKAQGAIIGKAMTRIDKNGFVLVLVNLQ